MTTHPPTSRSPALRETAKVFVAAFTLTELLVVIAVLVLLAATQLPALTRAQAPVKFTQCMNNVRRIGQAAMIYKDDNNDAYPFGNRCNGSGPGIGSVIDPYAWPMELLRYMGGYTPTNQPAVFLCPNENSTVPGWEFQMHYQCNRGLVTDVADGEGLPIRGSQLRNPALYWMFIEKSPESFCNIRSGALNNPILLSWNVSGTGGAFTWPGMVRHNWGTSSAAADGHVEWLRMPVYRPGSPPPLNFFELGDCASGVNPASTWQDSTTPGNHNGNRVKLFTRYQQGIAAAAF